jgi:8-amino-7-oxononanoate synthase
MADLQGCESATFAPSTLHLFWDLFGLWSRHSAAIYMDDGIYPIARWGIERAAGRGVSVHPFRHHDPDDLYQLLRRTRCRGSKPLIVTDGFSPVSGKPAPLASYLERARSFGGYLIMDDTQALGIFGHKPDSTAPYGHGGGGTLQMLGLADPNVLMLSSLAKGFGVPVAVLSGSKTAVELFEERSETRVHCSPPSIAHLMAVRHALAINNRQGEILRARLAQLVDYFRLRLARAGFSLGSGRFPVQTLANTGRLDVRKLHQRLLQLGIRTVPHRNPGPDQQKARISFIITALHTLTDIDNAGRALIQATSSQMERQTPGHSAAGHPSPLKRGAS